MSNSSPSPFEGPRKILKDRLAETVIKALKARGHRGFYVSSKKEALKSLLDMIPETSSVGVPGTVTIREIGAIEALEGRGNKVFQHWEQGLSKEEKNNRLLGELTSDFFLTSSNALTYDGILVNIDGSGNRIAGMSWAFGKIIYVIGMNKLCPDTEKAIRRVRDVATPLNAIRLGKDVPCAKIGYHVGCVYPKTLCRGLLITEYAMMGRDSTVILVGEDLGY